MTDEQLSRLIATINRRFDNVDSRLGKMDLAIYRLDLGLDRQNFVMSLSEKEREGWRAQIDRRLDLIARGPGGS